MTVTVEPASVPELESNEDPHGRIANSVEFMRDMFEDTVAGPLFLRRHALASHADASAGPSPQGAASMLKSIVTVYIKLYIRYSKLECQS